MKKKIMAVTGIGLSLMMGANVFADEIGSDADMEKYQMDDVYTAVSGTAFYHKADGTTETKSVYFEEEPGYEDDFWIEHNIENCKKQLNTWLEKYDVVKSETKEDLVLDYTYTYEINLGDYGFMPLATFEDDNFGYDDGLDDDYFMPTNMIVEVTEVHQVYTVEINAYEVDPDEQKEPENNEEINGNEGENNKPELDDNDNRNPQVDKDEDIDNKDVENVEKVEEKVQENVTTEQNPNTSDPILYSLGLFGISSLGIIKKIRK